MAQATINNPEIFDRKTFMKNAYAASMFKSNPTYKYRSNIIVSQNADGLSEEELRNHVSELRFRKLFSIIPLLGVPAAVYYFKSNPRLVVISLIPAYYLYNATYNSRIFNKEVAFSMDFSDKSKLRYYEKIASANGKRVFKPEEMWNEPSFTAGKDNFSVKDWIARNEYR
jgi:hypothetical protein